MEDRDRRGDSLPEGELCVVKMTIRPSADASTILRGVAADWGLSQHAALELLAKWFVATGGHLQSRIDFEGEPAVRIAAAVAAWRRRAGGAGS
jgi:hypothetical protein